MMCVIICSQPAQFSVLLQWLVQEARSLSYIPQLMDYYVYTNTRGPLTTGYLRISN